MRRRFFVWTIAAALLCSAFASADAPSDREFPIGTATTLRLNVSGSIHALAVSGLRSVRFHVAGDGSPPEVQVTESRSSRQLNLSISEPSQSVVPFAAGAAYELVVAYPANLQLDLREFAGRVHLDDVTAASQIYDANGDVVVDRTAAALTAEADNGDILVAHAGAALELTVGEGNVSAALAPDWNGKLVRLEASDGNLDLHVPPGFRARFDLSSGSGRVSNPLRSQSSGPLVFALAERGNVSILTL
jgi:hypothetical protein